MKNISYSWLYLYQWCPRQFKYQRIDKFKKDTPILTSTVMGIAIHEVVNKMYKNCNFELKYLHDLWGPTFTKHWKKHRFTTWSKKGYEKYEALGWKILDRFFKEAKKRGLLVQPIATELPFVLEQKLPSGKTVRVRGYIDLIIQPKNSDDVIVLDFKTGTYKLTVAELHDNEQLTIYSLAYRRLYKNVESKLVLFYIRSGDWLETKRTTEHYNKLLVDIDDVLQKIEREEFEPTYERCFLCPYSKRCQSQDLTDKTGVDSRWFFREPQ